MSTTLLVVIIFAMVISPIFWLMPSRRQRYQMHLRKMALHAGIKVRLEKFELNGEKLPATAYRWMRDADEKKTAHRFRLAHVPRMEKERLEPRGDEFIPGWLWLESPVPAVSDDQLEALKNVLEQLPEDSLIFEAGTATVTLWWRESGTPEQVESLPELMSGLPM